MNKVGTEKRKCNWQAPLVFSYGLVTLFQAWIYTNSGKSSIFQAPPTLLCICVAGHGCSFLPQSLQFTTKYLTIMFSPQIYYICLSYAWVAPLSAKQYANVFARHRFRCCCNASENVDSVFFFFFFFLLGAAALDLIICCFNVASDIAALTHESCQSNW